MELRSNKDEYGRAEINCLHGSDSFDAEIGLSIQEGALETEMEDLVHAGAIRGRAVEETCGGASQKIGSLMIHI